MMRLSEALARVHLSEVILPIHVSEAYRLLQRSIIRIESHDIELEEPPLNLEALEPIEPSKTGDNAMDTSDDKLEAGEFLVLVLR
jgi:DNA replication licensing factor MCM6